MQYLKLDIEIHDALYESIIEFLKNSRDFKDISEMINKSLENFIKSSNFLITTKNALDS